MNNAHYKPASEVNRVRRIGTVGALLLSPLLVAGCGDEDNDNWRKVPAKDVVKVEIDGWTDPIMFTTPDGTRCVQDTNGYISCDWSGDRG